MSTEQEYQTREIVTSFPSNINMVGPVRNFAGEIVTNFGHPALQTKVELCVEEVIKNIIEHAHLNDASDKIDLKMVISSGMIELSFSEKGIPFDPSMVKPFDFTTLQGGLGTTLVKSLSDKYEFENLGRNGKRINISFIAKQPEKPLIPLDNNSQVQPVIVDPGEIIYARLTGEDAVQLSRLAWLNYGYSYEDYIYFPDKLREKIRNGTITAFAAWHNGQLVGHVAIKSDTGNPRFPELGLAFVDPAYRRNNIFKILNSNLIDYLLGNSYDGFYCKAVTNHIISQKAAVDNLGMIAANVQLCILPENVSMNNLGNKNFKLSSITYARQLKQFVRNIYIPEKYKDLISKIYSWSGVEVNELLPPETMEYAQNNFSVSLAKDLNSAFITYEEIGEGFEHLIVSQIKEISDEGYPAIFLYLNITSPSLCSTIEFLNQQLFVFSGIQFNYFNQTDAIIFQRIENIPIDFSLIKIYSEEGNYLLNRIENEYIQRKD